MSRTLKTIHVDLFSNAGLKKAIAEVASFEKELIDGMNALCETLLDEGVSVAKMQIMEMPAVDTGELMGSIERGAFDKKSGFGIIKATAYYAIFVEYGTGIRGAMNPHPEAGEAGWDYDVNGHGDDGWYYKAWSDFKFHWTKGMPARPFMYNTLMTLKDMAEQDGMRIIGTYIPGGG